MNLRGMTKGLGKAKTKAPHTLSLYLHRLTHAPGLIFTYAPDSALDEPGGTLDEPR
jgi:hypothetical protein